VRGRRRLARTGARHGRGEHGVPAYGTPGGLRQKFERLAARNPRITKLVTIGETHRGQEIVALKVTRRAAQLRDGRRPAILYIGGQHAREWITPEMVRRLAQRVLGGYGADRALTDGVDSGRAVVVGPVEHPVAVGGHAEQ
jgi:hypothetical protein